MNEAHASWRSRQARPVVLRCGGASQGAHHQQQGCSPMVAEYFLKRSKTTEPSKIGWGAMMPDSCWSMEQVPNKRVTEKQVSQEAGSPAKGAENRTQDGRASLEPLPGQVRARSVPKEAAAATAPTDAHEIRARELPLALAR